MRLECCDEGESCVRLTVACLLQEAAGGWRAVFRVRTVCGQGGVHLAKRRPLSLCGRLLPAAGPVPDPEGRRSALQVSDCLSALLCSVCLSAVCLCPSVCLLSVCRSVGSVSVSVCLSVAGFFQQQDQCRARRTTVSPASKCLSVCLLCSVCCLSVFPSVCCLSAGRSVLCLSLSVCLSVCGRLLSAAGPMSGPKDDGQPCKCLSVCLYTCCPCVSLSVFLSVYLLPVCLSVCCL